MTNPAILIPMIGTVLGIYVLTRVDLHLKLVIASFERASHNKRYNFSVPVFVRLIFDIDVFGFRALADSVSVLSVFRAILGYMNPKKDFTAAGILTPLFTQLLAPSGFGELHRQRLSSVKR
jgi:hypothetical protein